MLERLCLFLGCFFLLASVYAQPANPVRVRYGYFTVARPFHAACARGWLDLKTTRTGQTYQVTCYPQTSGNYAVSRLDSNQLDIALLGSTPLAYALARGIDIQVVYISDYTGESQGIYVRDGTNLLSPFDLRGESIGVPFGSTIHYQLLYLIDLFGLRGEVDVIDMSPTSIMSAWEKGEIDAVGCWGVARDFVLSTSARTLLSSGVLADWGAPTYVVVAASRSFAQAHPEFMTHFVRVLSNINDSFEDRLGFEDSANIGRWETNSLSNTSFLSSVVDTLMIKTELPRDPSREQIIIARNNLELHEQQTAREQISCNYLGSYPGSCNTLTPQHEAILQTAQFLFNQKLIASLGPVARIGDNCPTTENKPCGGDVLDGRYLADANPNCTGCIPVGPYSNALADGGGLLEALEMRDAFNERGPFGPTEIGRDEAGDSTRSYLTILTADSFFQSFGDGANAENGKSYSDGLKHSWILQACEKKIEKWGNQTDKIETEDLEWCNLHVALFIDRLRLWSGDYLRVYEDPIKHECVPGGSTNVLLAKLSGHYEEEALDSIPVLRARNCLLVELETDSNPERSYGDIRNIGDGFWANYTLARGCIDSYDCNGAPCVLERCHCGGLQWGFDCSHFGHCLGTTRVVLADSSSHTIASSSFLTVDDLRSTDSEAAIPHTMYPNNLDCRFEIQVVNAKPYVKFVIYYDLENTHDLIELKSGAISSVTGNQGITTHAILTGVHNDSDMTFPEVYYVPTDPSGFVSLHLYTDNRGRRRGFVAFVEASDGYSPPDQCELPGSNGLYCNLKYCTTRSKLGVAKSAEIFKSSFVVGRVVSQVQDLPVKPMPWSLDGGCVWPIIPSKNVSPKEIIAIRLIFNSPLDFEPHSIAAIGDKLIIRTLVEGDTVFFAEKCDSDEMCSFPWQTGICGDFGNCIVHNTVQLNVTDFANATARLVTDRNDGDQYFAGLDFDVLLVKQCTEEGHCEDYGGECIDGFCYCADNIPCSCTCEGSRMPAVINANVRIVIGIVLPLFALILICFYLYRRKKIQKSREQKNIIKAKEAELEAFRDQIIGLRTSITEYIPRVRPNMHEEQARLEPKTISIAQTTAKVQWCWQETSLVMSNHSPDNIYGDPEECWIIYDDSSNQKLEAQFQSQGGKGTCYPTSAYEVDFDTMTQTKIATGFKRPVKRVVENGLVQEDQERTIDLRDVQFGDVLPHDLQGEPQMVLVKGDVVQISKQKDDWAFGTKLHHTDQILERDLLRVAKERMSDDDANVYADTGWFKLDATRVPSGDDLAAMKTSVGETGALDPPSYWDPVADPTVVQQFDLPEGRSERVEVENAFFSTMQNQNVKILSVQRVQNLGMWQSYVVKRRTICYREEGLAHDSTDGVDTKEKEKQALSRFERYWLWHGSNVEVMDKILQQGFNRSFCGKNATMYGKGVYFARDASYSACRAYAVPDKNGVQYIMACRVVVGEYCRGKKDALTPDIRDTKHNILYDSTVGMYVGDTMANPSIYVTYHDAQAYPEYLIKFKSSGERSAF